MALCMLLLCVACDDKPTTNNGGNDEKTYNLVFTTHLPETAIDGSSLKYFLEEVTKETNGRVTFETYFGGSMTKSGETLEAVSGSLADIAFVPDGFYESQFYPLFVAMLPYSTTYEWSVQPCAFWGIFFVPVSRRTACGFCTFPTAV